MATAWTIRIKTFASEDIGDPIWDSLSTDDTHDYDALTEHKWNWASDWSIFAKSTSDIGIVWAEVAYAWQADPTIYKENPWTIMNITKIQEATET